MVNKRSGHPALQTPSLDAPTYDRVLRIAGEQPVSPPGKNHDGSRVGIVDIAKMAGVSTITVSRALRTPEIVSEATRKKILEIVQRTGYVSHPYARALRVGHSNMVVAFVSSMISPQYSIAMERCSDILEDHGYQLLMGLTSYSYPKEISGISMLRAIRPAAALFTGAIELESNRQALRELGIPILESWAYPRDPIDMLVGFSNYDCGWLAARYLHEHHCKRAFFISREGGRGKLRQKGFFDGARVLGLRVEDSILLKDIQNLYDGKKVYRRLAGRFMRTDGIFCANDVLALGIYAEIRGMSADRPGRPLLLGFGDVNYMARTEPSLPIVGIDSALLGEKSARMILSKLAGKSQPMVDHVPLQVLDPAA